MSDFIESPDALPRDFGKGLLAPSIPPTPEKIMDDPRVVALVEALVKIRDRSPTVTTLMTDGSWREALRDVQRISRLALAQFKETTNDGN